MTNRWVRHHAGPPEWWGEETPIDENNPLVKAMLRYMGGREEARLSMRDRAILAGDLGLLWDDADKA